MKHLILITFLFNFLFSNTTPENIIFTSEEKSWIKNNTITVGIESAKPYIYYNNYTENIDGLYADILSLVINKSGLQVEFIEEDWNKLLNNFKNKKLDLLPATFYSKDREKYGFFSDPYYNVREYIYTKQNNTNVTSFNDLKNRKIAIVKGYATIEKLKNKYPSINIIQTENLTQSVTLLLNNKVDALIDYHLVVDTYIRDNSIVRLKSIAQSELDAISVHYLSHIKKPILHSILQKTLKSISRQEKNEVLREWLKHPFEDTVFSDKQRTYIANNTFNIYVKNWEPFTIYDENKNSFSGLSIDVWKKIVEETGINYKFVYEEHFLDMLEKTKVDTNGIIITSSGTEDRKKYANFATAYSSFPIGIATQTDEKYILNFKDLEGKTVAVGENYTAHKLLKKHYKNIKFVPVKSTDEALELLAKKKVFAAAEILPVLIGKMAKHNYSNLKISGSSDVEFKLEIMVNKSSTQLIDILNKSIEKLNKKNQIQQIKNNWLTKPRVVESFDYSLMYKILIPTVIILLFLLLLYLTQRKSNQVIKKQKEELKNLNDRYELTLEAVEDGIWDWDIQNGHLYFSKNWAKMIGYEVNELDNNIDTFYDLLHPDDHEPLKEMLNYHFKDTHHNKFSLRIRLKCKNGEFKWIFTRGKALLDKKNKPLRMLGNHSDITQEIKREEHIKAQDNIISEQSKMAAMGEMIGNIAHQWRQPLSVITTGTAALKIQNEYGTLTDEILNDTCDTMNNNAQYLSKTIDDFRNFIKGDSNQVKFKLSDNIQHFLSLVNSSVKTNNIDIVLNLDDTIVLKSYPNELIQCLMNIYNNSKDALLENGITEDERHIFITTQKSDSHVIISIKDNAGGIPSDILEKVFEPYFTTKHQSIGTGLGLSMTYNLIVDGMEGTIEVENVSFVHKKTNYRGALFSIVLPN